MLKILYQLLEVLKHGFACQTVLAERVRLGERGDFPFGYNVNYMIIKSRQRNLISFQLSLLKQVLPSDHSIKEIECTKMCMSSCGWQSWTVRKLAPSKTCAFDEILKGTFRFVCSIATIYSEQPRYSQNGCKCSLLTGGKQLL